MTITISQESFCSLEQKFWHFLFSGQCSHLWFSHRIQIKSWIYILLQRLSCDFPTVLAQSPVHDAVKCYAEYRGSKEQGVGACLGTLADLIHMNNFVSVYKEIPSCYQNWWKGIIFHLFEHELDEPDFITCYVKIFQLFLKYNWQSHKWVTQTILRERKYLTTIETQGTTAEDISVNIHIVII